MVTKTLLTNGFRSRYAGRMANYSLWLVEYSHVRAQPISAVLYGQHNRGTRELAFSYLVIKGEGHVILVDVGTNNDDPHTREMCERDGVEDWQPPLKTLAKIGLSPAQVDTVIITHAHFDHMGNMEAFPNAAFYLQKRELADWLWAVSLPERFRVLCVAINPNDLQTALRLVDEKRMILVNGELASLLPGIHLTPAYDGHTFASQMVTIENATGGEPDRWVAIGDLAYVRQSFTGVTPGTGYVPVGVAVGPQYTLLKTLDDIMARAGGRLEKVIISHETDNWTMFPSWKGADGLHVAELTLAPGESSKIPPGAH
jgi:N-acyl homoserine lactone hydrolase